MLTRAECSDKSFLAVLIFDETLTLALRNDKEVISGLALLNFDLFWLRHHKFDLGDHVVLDLGVERENQVLLQLL